MDKSRSRPDLVGFFDNIAIRYQLMAELPYNVKKKKNFDKEKEKSAFGYLISY